MSAMDTALRVLIWAADESRGPAPTGVLSAVTELARPPSVVRRAVARLGAVTAARLRLTAPPFDDDRPLGGEAVLVAAAVGARADLAAIELLRAAGSPSGAYDLLVRHALAGPLVAAEPGDDGVLGALRAASPLTALLDHPGGGAAMAAEAVLDDVLLAHPEGRRLLTEHFGRRPDSRAQSQWRGGLLQQLRASDPALVLDIYEAATSRYGAELVAWVAEANRGLSFGAGFDRARVEPVAKWWQALAFLDRSRNALLRSRIGLTNYRPGVTLYWNAWRLGVVK